mgnify:CR=1 FL=1
MVAYDCNVAHQKQLLFTECHSGVKIIFLEKIITYSWHSYILQAEITSLDYRYVYAHCRRGLSTFAAFCLSKNVLTQNKAISCVGCRSPPANLDFQKNSDWRKQYGIQQSQRRKEMAALERS